MQDDHKSVTAQSPGFKVWHTLLIVDCLKCFFLMNAFSGLKCITVLFSPVFLGTRKTRLYNPGSWVAGSIARFFINLHTSLFTAATWLVATRVSKLRLGGTRGGFCVNCSFTPFIAWRTEGVFVILSQAGANWLKRPPMAVGGVA